MTSFMGRLARTLSSGGDGMHHRVTSAPEAIEIPKAEAIKPRMSTSPSFNDFSLRVEEDAQEELGWLMPSLSMDSSSQANACDLASPTMSDGSSLRSVASCNQSTLLPTAAAAAAAPAQSSPAPIPPKGKLRTKIMGMDAYDYCDLIRTSSL